MEQPRDIKRVQHPSFGSEFRPLFKNDPDLAGIIVEELDALTAARKAGGCHTKEDRLNGDHLRSVCYLRLYRKSESIRIYFTMISNTLWMLHLDVGKRQTKVSDGTTRMLTNRLAEVQRLDKECRAAEKNAREVGRHG